MADICDDCIYRDYINNKSSGAHGAMSTLKCSIQAEPDVIANICKVRKMLEERDQEIAELEEELQDIKFKACDQEGNEE